MLEIQNALVKSQGRDDADDEVEDEFDDYMDGKLQLDTEELKNMEK